MRIGLSRKSNAVLASAARTTSGTSAPFSVGSWQDVAVYLDATTVSGTTPTLDVEVEWSHDGTTWFSADAADTFAQVTVAGKVVKLFSAKGSVARLNYTVGGTTPSFTFSATAVIGS